MTSGKTDDVKGKVKEAAGVLTNDDDLKKEGQLDQKGASVKKAVESVGEKVGDAVDSVKDKLHH